MNGVDYGNKISVIVLGSRRDEFIRRVVSLLGSYEEIEFVTCRDVYRAVGKLAKNGIENALVIGRIEQLSREAGRFLRIVSDRAFRCCCLAEANSVSGHLQTLSCHGMDCFIVNEIAEIERVIEGFLAESLSKTQRKDKARRPSEFNKKAFATTKAELDALLGV